MKLLTIELLILTRMKHLLAATSAIAQAYIFFPLAARAQAPEGLSGANTALEEVGGETGAASGPTLTELIGGLINVVLGFMGIFLVIYIVWAGYIYASSAGEKEKIDKAKKMISSAVIGLVLIIAAYAIASYVISALTTATTG
jgi:hypothetical protein